MNLIEVGEKIGVRFVQSLLETFPVHNKEAALRQLGVIKESIDPKSVMGSGSLQQIIQAFNDDGTRYKPTGPSQQVKSW